MWGRKQNLQNPSIVYHSGCEGKDKLTYIAEEGELGTWEKSKRGGEERKEGERRSKRKHAKT